MARQEKQKKSGIPPLVALVLLVGLAAFVFLSLVALGTYPLIDKTTGPVTASVAAVATTPAADRPPRVLPAMLTPAAVDDRPPLQPSPTSMPISLGDRPTRAAPSTTTLGAPGGGPPLISPATLTPAPSVAVAFDNLYSPYAILVRLDDQAVLMQKNSDEKIYPASLSKIMTAIVAIENLPDLEAEIELTDATFAGLSAADASQAGFQPGERVRAIDLLYGLLLPSGAECGIGLAEQVAGSEANFVTLMNQKAAALGMAHTHFENVTGLHSDNHYTTVSDLATLLSYALQNPTFREIFTAARYSTPPTNVHPGGITFYSLMFAELNNPYLVEGEILGGKTGYTVEAGLCLASLAVVGGQEYILVTAGAEGDHFSEQYNLTDAVAVYNSLGN